MKKGLKKLVAGVVAAMTLALPISISVSSQQAQASKFLPSYEDFVKEMEEKYGKDWADKALEDWYNRPGVIKPPVLDKQ